MNAIVRFRLTHDWPFFLTAAFLFFAVLLRTLIIYRTDNSLLSGLILLFIWMILMIGSTQYHGQRTWFFPVYLAAQSFLIMFLFRMPIYPDYFSVLFAVLSMQVVQRYPPQKSIYIIILFTPLMIIGIKPSLGIGQAAALGVLYTGVNALMAIFALTAQRAREAKEFKQSLLKQLVEANDQLNTYALQAKDLVIARERNNLAKELHDSITQTIFSMTLTTKSALILIGQDITRVNELMLRLDHLAQNAINEMRVLINELGPEKAAAFDLRKTVEDHIYSSELYSSHQIQIDTRGKGILGVDESKCLFRIIQEALNNASKHAQSSQVTVSLFFEDTYSIEIEDNGIGFDINDEVASDHYGLQTMRERAESINWSFQLSSSPGNGTKIRVEKNKVLE